MPPEAQGKNVQLFHPDADIFGAFRFTSADSLRTDRFFDTCSDMFAPIVQIVQFFDS
jgi:hypothetical protein